MFKSLCTIAGRQSKNLSEKEILKSSTYTFKIQSSTYTFKIHSSTVMKYTYLPPLEVGSAMKYLLRGNRKSYMPITDY